MLQAYLEPAAWKVRLSPQSCHPDSTALGYLAVVAFDLDQ